GCTPYGAHVQVSSRRARSLCADPGTPVKADNTWSVILLGRPGMPADRARCSGDQRQEDLGALELRARPVAQRVALREREAVAGEQLAGIELAVFFEGAVGEAGLAQQREVIRDRDDLGDRPEVWHQALADLGAVDPVVVL